MHADEAHAPIPHVVKVRAEELALLVPGTTSMDLEPGIIEPEESEPEQGTLDLEYIPIEDIAIAQ